MSNLENLEARLQAEQVKAQEQKAKAIETQKKLKEQIRKAKKEKKEKEKKALTRQKIILGGLYFKFQNLKKAESGKTVSYEKLIEWLDGECKRLESQNKQNEIIHNNTHGDDMDKYLEQFRNLEN